MISGWMIQPRQPRSDNEATQRGGPGNAATSFELILGKGLGETHHRLAASRLIELGRGEGYGFIVAQLVEHQTSI